MSTSFARFARAFALLPLVMLGACGLGPSFDEVSPIEAALADVGPYETRVVVRSPGGVSRQDVIWRVADVESRAPLARLGQDGAVYRMAGSIPAQPGGTEVQWAVEVCDAAERCVRAPDSGWFTFDVPHTEGALVVSRMEPTTGPASGGTQVALTGDGFVPGMRVLFGDDEAPVVDVQSGQILVVRTPAVAPGAVEVRVAAPGDRSAAAPEPFVFTPAPVVTGVFPGEGPTRGGTALAVSGAGFEPGVRVFVDGVPCRRLARTDDVSITCETPPGRAGVVDVRVENVDGGAFVVTGGFTYIPAPRVDRVEPDRGPVEGGNTVTVFGTDFGAGATASVGGTPCLETRVVSDTMLECDVPEGETGTAAVRVENADGQVGELPGAYVYIGPPVVVAIIPDEGPRIGGNEVRLYGAGLFAGAQVFVDGIEAQVVDTVDGVELTFIAPPTTRPLTPVPVTGVARVDVRVVNPAPDMRETTVTGGYGYFWPPEVLSVTPASGPTAGGTAVLIEGRFFRQPDPDAFFVRFGAAEATQIAVLSPERITAVTPPGMRGFVDVQVENGFSSAGQLPDGFEYIPPPRIDRVEPAEGPTFGGERVRVVGVDFRDGALVLFGGRPCRDVTFISAAILECTTPPGDEGFTHVEVRNPDGQNDVLLEGYRYLGLSVTPGYGLTAGFARVVIRAGGMRDGAQFFFGNTLAGDCTVESSTRAVCQTPAHASGRVEVSFVNPDGTGERRAEAFRYGAYHDESAARLTPTGRNGNHAVPLDVDLDGDLDFIVVNGISGETNPRLEQDEIYINDGTGTFDVVPFGEAAISHNVQLGDVNGDAFVDLVIANGNAPGALFFVGDGAGNFTETAVPGMTSGAFDAVLADLVGDEQDDLFIAAIGCSGRGGCDNLQEGRDGLFERTGPTSFVDRSTRVPHRDGLQHDHKVAVGDWDLDGDLDLFVTVDNRNFSVNENNHRVLENTPSGFVERTTGLEGLVGDIFDIDVGDIDGDGDLDVVAPSCEPFFDSSTVVLQNDGSGGFTRNFAAVPSLQTVCYYGSAVVDLEGDGDLDVLFTGSALLGGPHTAALFVNRGDGTFVDASDTLPVLFGSQLGTEFIAGDFDSDGDIDLVETMTEPTGFGAGRVRFLGFGE